MTKKQLPDFSVTGTLDELIRAEMLLVLLGYDEPREDWNNNHIKERNITHIVVYDFGGLVYRPFEGCFSQTTLPASDLEAIERYFMERGVK